MNIQFRAKKILGSMGSFHEIDRQNLLDEIGNQMWINTCIGVYQNKFDSFEDCVFVCEDCIVVEWQKEFLVVQYLDIDTTRCPHKDMEPVIIATLKDGRDVLIPIRNGRDKFRDVFEFNRFLDRATETAHKNAKEKN